MTSASASRVTRSRHNLQLALLLFVSCLAVVTVLRAQEPAAPAKPQETTAGTEARDARKSVEATAPAAAGKDKDEPPANPDRKPGAVGSTPGRFEPTEKVRADFDVSFPVDI